MTAVKKQEENTIRGISLEQLCKIIESNPELEEMILANNYECKARIVQFPRMEQEKKVKYTKAGEIKRTPNNQEEDRWADPIRDKEDVQKCIDYLRNRAVFTCRKDTKFAAVRNYALFIVGINVGLRMSDLLKLRWKDIFMSDMKTFVESKGTKEKKTGKIKEFIPNKAIIQAISFYLKETGINPEPENYVFIASKGKSKQLNNETVSKFVKHMTKTCGIQGDYCARSVRKTYAYQLYLSLLDRGEEFALVAVQKALNHSNSAITAQYLGLTRQKLMEDTQKLADYLDLNIADSLSIESVSLV